MFSTPYLCTNLVSRGQVVVRLPPGQLRAHRLEDGQVLQEVNGGTEGTELMEDSGEMYSFRN